MDRASLFRVNSPRVIHELFEGEVVVVNLDSGRYYNLQQCGAEAWLRLADGGSPADVIEMLGARYVAKPGEIEQAVDALVEELVREGLLVHAGAAAREQPVEAQAAGGAERAPFVAPTVQVFTDMQDLLLLDPIHEVDAEGWPLARRNGPTIEPAE